MLREALEINRQFRPQHPVVGDNLSGLADLESQRGDHRQAERLSRDALSIYRLKLSESHPDTVSEKMQLSEILLTRGRPREAEPLALEAYRALADGEATSEVVAGALEILIE